jgi:hypothetical protein
MGNNVEHSHMNVKQINQLYQDEQLVVPQIQRDLVWKEARVEKYLKNWYADKFSLSSLVFVKYKDGKLGILDGQQRIKTNNNFINSKITFRLNGRKVFFSDLLPEDQERMLNKTIAIDFVILNEEEEGVQYRGLNNGQPMLPQERINSITSEAANFINKTLCKHSFFKLSNFYGLDTNGNLNAEVTRIASIMLFNVYVYNTSKKNTTHDEEQIISVIHSVPLDENACTITLRILDEMVDIFEGSQEHICSMGMEAVIDRFNYLLSLFKRDGELKENLKEVFLNWSKAFEETRKIEGAGGYYSLYNLSLRKVPSSTSGVKKRFSIVSESIDDFRTCGLPKAV